MRSILGLFGVAVLAALANTSSGAIITLTDTVGDPAAVTVLPGASFSFNAVLTLVPTTDDPVGAAAGVGFNLHSSQSSIFTITARSVNPANPFTDLTTTDAQMLANTPQLNPQNGTDLGGTTPDGLNQPAATYALYTFTLATSATAPAGTYQITIVEGAYTNTNFDTFTVDSSTYNVTVAPEPVSIGLMGAFVGSLALRRRPAGARI